MPNSVFMHGDPVSANVCVGKNVFINYLTYAKGFKSLTRSCSRSWLY